MLQHSLAHRAEQQALEAAAPARADHHESGVLGQPDQLLGRMTDQQSRGERDVFVARDRIEGNRHGSAWCAASSYTVATQDLEVVPVRVLEGEADCAASLRRAVVPDHNPVAGLAELVRPDHDDRPVYVRDQVDRRRTDEHGQRGAEAAAPDDRQVGLPGLRGQNRNGKPLVTAGSTGSPGSILPASSAASRQSGRRRHAGPAPARTGRAVPGTTARRTHVRPAGSRRAAASVAAQQTAVCAAIDPSTPTTTRGSCTVPLPSPGDTRISDGPVTPTGTKVPRGTASYR